MDTILLRKGVAVTVFRLIWLNAHRHGNTIPLAWFVRVQHTVQVFEYLADAVRDIIEGIIQSTALLFILLCHSDLPFHRAKA